MVGWSKICIICSTRPAGATKKLSVVMLVAPTPTRVWLEASSMKEKIHAKCAFMQQMLQFQGNTWKEVSHLLPNLRKKYSENKEKMKV